MNAAEFVQKLVEEVPALRQLYLEHLAANSELLTHVFFGDVTRSFVAAYDAYSSQRDTIENLDVVSAVISRLENGLIENNAEIKNLILASFLYNLCPEYCRDEQLKRMLGFNLRRGFEQMCENE